MHLCFKFCGESLFGVSVTINVSVHYLERFCEAVPGERAVTVPRPGGEPVHYAQHGRHHRPAPCHKVLCCRLSNRLKETRTAKPS